MQFWDKLDIIEDKAQNVSKYVFTKKDAVAEAVLYKYPDFATRTVICCSTQSGCPIGCRFCGAGDFFARSLTTDEILEQPIKLIEETKTDPNIMGRLQIMFMSMGEPLLNLKNLIPALYQLHRLYPKAALLISTSGPDIGSTFKDLVEVSMVIPTIGLQFSIHESTDEARNKLIPFKKKWTLKEIAQKGADWNRYTGRKPFFNYCAHDKNSSVEDADRLLNLYSPDKWCATVSVICERNEGLPATNQYQRDLATNFASLLLERGYNTRVFDPAGQDNIGGGCGQLWFVQNWVDKNPDKVRKSVGAGLPEVHTPKL